MLMRRFLNNWGWALAGALYGIVLWFIAQGFLAPLVGRPFMLGFVSYTWVSLVAHLIYALTIAYVIDRLQRRL
jgi:membrane protein implicated in regulation of membrane protease activity